MKITIYVLLALAMMTKLVYDMSSVHDLVVALEGIALALMVVGLFKALKYKK